MKGLRVSASVLKILVGVIFIVSAVSKYVTIDSFEMYVYSFGLFPLTLSFYIARLVLAFELILGAALISHRHHRFTMLMSLLFLVCFIIFLTYAHFIGRTDSCHCFGDLLPFEPVQSILKNAVLILVLLYAFKYAPADWTPRWWLVLAIYVAAAGLLILLTAKSFHIIDIYSIVLIVVMLCVGLLASFPFYNRWYVTAALILAPIVATFILTPPDNWFYNETDERFDKELFVDQLNDARLDMQTDSVSSDLQSGALADCGLSEGRHIVAFFSPGCGYCRLAAGKLSTIATRYDLDTTRLLYVFPQVADTTRYADFYRESRSQRYRETRIDKDLFVRITRASFPIVVLLDNGEIQYSFAYRNIDESIVRDFIRQ